MSLRTGLGRLRAVGVGAVTLAIGGLLGGCCVAPEVNPGVATLEVDAGGMNHVRILNAESAHVAAPSPDLGWAAAARSVRLIQGQASVPSVSEIAAEHQLTPFDFFSGNQGSGGSDLSSLPLPPGVPANLVSLAESALERLEIRDSLAPGYVDQYRGRLIVTIFDASKIGDAEYGTVVRGLAQGEPTVLGLGTSDAATNTVVVVGATYSSEDCMSVQSFDVLDPSAGPAPVTMTVAEIADRVRFALRPSDVAQRFQDDFDWLTLHEIEDIGVYGRPYVISKNSVIGGFLEWFMALFGGKDQYKESTKPLWQVEL